jgi:2-polyprenyl-3-methyl-5-hydroxy-6-metoxy-1,4-benzoquinol methylase
MTLALSPRLDERLVTSTTGALELFSIHLGTRLGLYRAIQAFGPVLAQDLADQTGIALRYAREWLEQQAVAGFIDVDDPAAAWDERRYALTPEQAAVLAEPEDPTHLAGLADMIVGVGKVIDEVLEAYRTGGGVAYRRYGADFRRGQAGVNRPAFTHDLAGSWLAAFPDLRARLAEGLPLRIADLGSGEGWSTIALAQAFPNADVVGYDADEASVDAARGHAAERGVNVRFEARDAGELVADGPWDLVIILEALHDMARPAEVLGAVRRALAPGGSVVIADEAVADQFGAPGDELERFMYGWSVSHCLPAAMAEQPSAALGTVLRPATVEALAREAGFGEFEIAGVDAGFFRIYRLRA